METVISFFDINTVLIEVLSYRISVIEFVGTLLGLVSVWLALRANIHTWSTGILNAVAFAVLYYQVQLYSDMLLQFFFIGVCIHGWQKWKRMGEAVGDKKVGLMTGRGRKSVALSIVILAIVWGWFMSNVHHYLPSLFPKAAAFPYADAFTTVLSVFAVFLLAHKRIEAWILWILIDIVSVYLYFAKGIVFVSIEYFVFLILATSGLFTWIKFWKDAERTSSGEVPATT